MSVTAVPALESWSPPQKKKIQLWGPVFNIQEKIFIRSMHYAHVYGVVWYGPNGSMYVCTYTQNEHNDKVLQRACYAILLQSLNI